MVVSETGQVIPFRELAPRTDLWKTPRNWLRLDHRLGTPRIGSVSTQETLAQVNLEELVARTFEHFEDSGIDFIGSAENVKELFKMPYSNKAVSMAIHRIESSLVICRAPDLEEAKDVKVCGSEILGGEHKPRKVASSTIQRQTLDSKFLYHSIVPQSESVSSHLQPHIHSTGTPVTVSDLSHEPNVNKPTSTRSDDPEQTPAFQTFRKALLWNFHNFRMVLGSNLLTFWNERIGNDIVSLRLQDLDHPISPNLSLDFYLDNVIADVPKVALCQHKSGFVEDFVTMMILVGLSIAANRRHPLHAQPILSSFQY